MQSLPGLGYPALLARPAHVSAGIATAREEWVVETAARRAGQLALASAGVAVTNTPSPPTPAAVSSSTTTVTETIPTKTGGSVGKGSGFHRCGGVEQGGNSVHALLARLVVMESLATKGGFDSELMQASCLRVVSGEHLPDGFLPSYLDPLIESFARGGKVGSVRAGSWQPTNNVTGPCVSMSVSVPLSLSLSLSLFLSVCVCVRARVSVCLSVSLSLSLSLSLCLRLNARHHIS